MWPMHMRAAVSYAGSTVATVGGLAAMALAQVVPPAPAPPGTPTPAVVSPTEAMSSSTASYAAMIIATGGLLSTVLPHCHAALKLYLDERREDRKSREARHELASRTQTLEFEVALMKSERDENRKLIALLVGRHDIPSCDHPDPPGDLRRAAGVPPAPESGPEPPP